MTLNPFIKLGLPANPVILAPLAGVSDHPFRRTCQEHGADLTYVEMISATALLYQSKRTLDMLYRHESEPILGVQLTARSAEEMGQACAIMAQHNFDTLDINMGCPVRKVVKAGCGSAILKDPKRVYETTLAACKTIDIPVSVKIRLGWDHESLNYLEVAQAAQEAGAAWITVHGRTRNDSYQNPVDLESIAKLKESVNIPVIGNGNLFSANDAALMKLKSSVDGLMVSRGALGNPWIFAELKGKKGQTELDDWHSTLLRHLARQREAYGEEGIGSVCMRKHLLWYVSGWPHARKIREQLNSLDSLSKIEKALDLYAKDLKETGSIYRYQDQLSQENHGRFIWNPSLDMDRSLDRGVGEYRL